MNNLLPIEIEEEFLELVNDETEEEQDSTAADLTPDTVLDTTSGQYSIEFLIKEFADESLHVPFYQRRKGVWTTTAKSELIDSVFKNVPLGSITVFQKNDDSRDVVDGLQRLNTLFQFRNDEFPVTLTAFSNTANRPWIGKKFSELDLKDQKRFERHLLTLQIIKLKYSDLSEEAVDQNAHFVFERMNKNAKPLTSVEIDMAVLHSEFLEKLKNLSDETFYWSKILKIKETSQAYLRYSHFDYLVKALALSELLTEDIDDPLKNYQSPMKKMAMEYLKRSKKIISEAVPSKIDILKTKLLRLNNLQLNGLVTREKGGHAVVASVFQNMLAYYLKYNDQWTDEIVKQFFSSAFKTAVLAKQNLIAGSGSTTDKKVLVAMFQWLEEQRQQEFRV